MLPKTSLQYILKSFQPSCGFLQKQVTWFVLQIKRLVSTWNETLGWSVSSYLKLTENKSRWLQHSVGQLLRKKLIKKSMVEFVFGHVAAYLFNENTKFSQKCFLRNFLKFSEQLFFRTLVKNCEPDPVSNILSNMWTISKYWKEEDLFVIFVKNFMWKKPLTPPLRLGCSRCAWFVT